MEKNGSILDRILCDVEEIMAGDCWAVGSPYKTQLIKDQRIIVITDRETVEKFF